MIDVLDIHTYFVQKICQIACKRGRRRRGRRSLFQGEVRKQYKFLSHRIANILFMQRSLPPALSLSLFHCEVFIKGPSEKWMEWKIFHIANMNVRCAPESFTNFQSEWVINFTRLISFYSPFAKLFRNFFYFTNKHTKCSALCVVPWNWNVKPHTIM